MVATRSPSVHSGLLGFTRTLQRVVWNVQVRVGSLGRASGSWGSLGFAWVHTGKPSGRRVNSGSRGFTLALKGVVNFIRVGVISSGRSRGRRVHSGSRWLTRAHIGVVGFIGVHLGSLRRT